MKILFFGNLGVLQGEGKPGPSSIVRVTNIVKMLTKHGYDCSIEYLNVCNYKRNYIVYGTDLTVAEALGNANFDKMLIG